MAGITFGGLATGLDSGAIIRQLVQLESRPIQRLESRRSELLSKQNQFSTFKSKLEELSRAITGLGDAEELGLFTATSSDEDAVRVSAGGNALPGSFTVQVNSLAAAQSESYLSGLPDTDTSTFGSGTITFTQGGDDTEIDVESTDTLQDIRDKINDSDADVRASIINDGSGFHLVFKSTETGTENAFTVSSTDFDGGGEVDPLAQQSSSTAASDAEAVVDGLTITSSNNTLDDAIEDISIELRETTGSPVDVTVSRDNEAIAGRLEEFVGAYNDVLDFIDAQGDSQDVTLRGIKSSLSSTVQSTLGSDFDFVSLSQVGITTNSASRLELDRSDLDSAIDNDFEGLTELFTGTADDDGLSAIFDRVLNGDTDTAGILTPGDGTLQARQTSLGDRLRGIDHQIERAEDRLVRIEQNLTRRFASLEALTSQFQAQGAFLGQAL